MSQLRSNPIREVPKRVLLNALVITVLIIGVSLVFRWSTLPAVIGFWMGVVVNLINFRIIVIGSKNFLEKREAGKKASMTPNIMLRYFLYGVVFVVAWRIGTSALMTSLLGACMVNFAFKTDGFFTMGMEKQEDTNLMKRANIERVLAEEEEIEGNDGKESSKASDSEEEEIEVYL